jgi:hypothetical protein
VHGCSHTIAVALIAVVAHANLVAVVQHGAGGQGQEQAVEQFHLAAVVIHQRRQPAADAQVQAHARIAAVLTLARRVSSTLRNLS